VLFLSATLCVFVLGPLAVAGVGCLLGFCTAAQREALKKRALCRTARRRARFPSSADWSCLAFLSIISRCCPYGGARGFPHLCDEQGAR
jgi:hypothetical protein